MESLHVRLLGEFSASVGKEGQVGPTSQKARELLAYLLLFRNRPHSRESLAGLLWADIPTEQSKKYLRQALWQLRISLSGRQRGHDLGILRIEGDCLQINPKTPMFLDVAVVEGAFDNSESVVAALHAQGRKVVCYMNAGGWEDWRPDADRFPAEVIGAPLDDWEGERWLDIRKIDALGPLMEARIDLCEARGFDGIEPDNVDGYLNNTGFPLTYEDQLTYNIWFAAAAHKRGLSVGLKNDLEQIPVLLPLFDWALNEQCFQYEECQTLLPFIDAGKPVFHVEYELEAREFCESATALGFNSLKKNWDLDASRQPCE